MPGNIQVLRFAPRKTLDRSLHNHQLGLIRPDSARTLGTPAHVYLDDFPGAKRCLDAALKRRASTRGQRPNHVVDVVVAGPPGFKTGAAWDDEKIHRWAHDVVAWTRDVMGPSAAFSSAALHVDESSPHLHLLVVPVDSEGRLSWTSLQREAATRLNGGVPPPRKRGADYVFLQDHLYEHVSRHYGLGRGEKGSKKKHAVIDRLRGAQRSLEILEAERAEVARLKDQLAHEARGMVGDAQRHKALAKEEADALLSVAGRDAQQIRSAAAEAVRRQAESDAKLGTAGGVALTKAAREGRKLRTDWEQKVRLLEAELAATKRERDAAQSALRTSEEEAVTVRNLIEAERAKHARSIDQRVRENAEARAYWERRLGESERARTAAEQTMQLMRAREDDVFNSGVAKGRQEGDEDRRRLAERVQTLRSGLEAAAGEQRRHRRAGAKTFFDHLLPILETAGLLQVLQANERFARLRRSVERFHEDAEKAAGRGGERGTRKD